MDSTEQHTDGTSDFISASSQSSPNVRPGSQKDAARAKIPPPNVWLWFVLILLLNYLLASYIAPGPETPVTVPYTLFKQEVGKGNVDAIYSRGESVSGRFKVSVTYPPDSAKSTVLREPSRPVRSFTTTLPSFVDRGLEQYLIDHGVEISAKPFNEERSPFENILYSFGPGLVLIGFYVWLLRRSAKQGGGFGGGIFGIGKSSARRYDRDKDPKVSFSDVAGIDEARTELVEVVDFLKDPSRYTRLGGTAP
jgi:cell division protease FtsH